MLSESIPWYLEIIGPIRIATTEWRTCSCTLRRRESRSDPLTLQYSHHTPQENNEAESEAGICVQLLILQQLHWQPDGRWHHHNQHGNVLPLPSPQHLSSPCLPHQQSKKPAHGCQSRSGSRPLAQGCLCGKWDKPSRKSQLASYNIMQIRKRPGETRVGETSHDQGYVVRLCIHPRHTRRVSKGRACTHQAGGISCFHQHLPGLHSIKQSWAVHSRSLTEWDPKGTIASTEIQGETMKKINHRISIHTSQDQCHTRNSDVIFT